MLHAYINYNGSRQLSSCAKPMRRSLEAPRPRETNIQARNKECGLHILHLSETKNDNLSQARLHYCVRESDIVRGPEETKPNQFVSSLCGLFVRPCKASTAACGKLGACQFTVPTHILDSPLSLLSSLFNYSQCMVGRFHMHTIEE